MDGIPVFRWWDGICTCMNLDVLCAYLQRKVAAVRSIRIHEI